MSRNLSSTARQAINASSTSEAFLVLLEISHSSLGTPIRVVNNTEDITSNSNVYTAVAFNFTPPVEEDGTIKNASLTIDNVDRTIVQTIRSLASPPTITVYIVLYSDPDTYEAGPWEFTLRNVSYNVQTVSGDLVYLNYLRNYSSPTIYNANSFPGLYA